MPRISSQRLVTRLRHDLARSGGQCAPGRIAGYRQAAPSAQVVGCQRGATVAQLIGSAVEHDLAAALARTRTHVDDAVGLQHDLRIMFDHQQRIAGIAQPLHDGDDTLHVARMQADRRLIQHEQGIHQRGAQRRGEIDALDFTARERARLPVQGQIGQPHVRQKTGAAAQFIEQQVRGLVQRRRQFQAPKERQHAFHRQQHQIVQAQSRQRIQRLPGPLHALGHGTAAAPPASLAASA